VVHNDANAFALVRSEPVAKIERLRYLLLLWPEKSLGIFAPSQKIASPSKAKNNESENKKGVINVDS